MALPIQETAYSFVTSLVNSLDPSQFLVNPTIATGDFKISKDGGALANLATLPTVSPAGSSLVLVSLSALEMTGEKITVQAIDVAGDEWEDLSAFIDTPEGSVETVLNIQEGDRAESSVRLLIKKKDTSTVVLDKTITGSLLSPSVTVTTKEPT